MEILLDFFWAFLIGGMFCVIGQLLIDLTNLTPARILVFFVVAGVILGASGIYDKFAEFAGSGATVPLVGFGYTLARGVREAITAQGFWGALTGGISSTAAGITAVMAFALIAALIFKHKDKTAKKSAS